MRGVEVITVRLLGGDHHGEQIHVYAGQREICMPKVSKPSAIMQPSEDACLVDMDYQRYVSIRPSVMVCADCFERLHGEYCLDIEKYPHTTWLEAPELNVEDLRFLVKFLVKVLATDGFSNPIVRFVPEDFGVTMVTQVTVDREPLVSRLAGLRLDHLPNRMWIGLIAKDIADRFVEARRQKAMEGVGCKS